jgi:MarR family transcriptional regulator, transcriptional regulator for hemolysin
MGDEWIGPRIAALYERQSAWLEPRLAALGVPWGTFQLLTAVAAAAGRASQAEVARRLGITPATLSETVFSHVQRGLLEQVSSESDRRVKTLRPTDRGRALLRKIHALLEEAEAATMEGLTSGERDQLARLLDKVLDSALTAQSA